MRLRVNFIDRPGHLIEAGSVIPDGTKLPLWVIRKHRCSEQEGRQICEDRKLLRERRAKEKALALENAKQRLGLQI